MRQTMIKKNTAWAVLFYGVILLLLGIYAYSNSGSKVSLYSGGGSGVLLILCSFLMFAHINWGRRLALGLSLLLTIAFAIRYSMTQKQLFAGLALLSAGMLLFLLLRSVQWKRYP